MDEISVESVPSRKEKGGRERKERKEGGRASPQKQSNLNWNAAQNLGDIKPGDLQFGRGEK